MTKHLLLAKLKSITIFKIKGQGIDKSVGEIEGSGHSFGEIQPYISIPNNGSGDGSTFGYDSKFVCSIILFVEANY